jgi:peptidoglycan/xylan/chitin deacetylase (PgdA/CDA1 family)
MRCAGGIFVIVALLAAAFGASFPSGGPGVSAVEGLRSVTTTVRKVAVTIDDVPTVAIPRSKSCDYSALEGYTSALLATLNAHFVPAVGFVVEGNWCKDLPPGLLDEILGMWLDAGMDLGNHTYSHPDLNRTGPASYKEDIVQGEGALRRALGERGQRLRWFRYPQLHAGDSPEVKAEIEHFLSERGYKIAPVTIDNQEYVFANLYRDAKEAGDAEMMGRIVEAYLAHMRDVFEFFEQYSVEVVGYELPQVLLLHANALNADHLEDLLSMLEARGYEFVSLEEALVDPAYSLDDTYVGPRGLSWLHRWALGKGMTIRMEPSEEKYLRKLQ